MRREELGALLSATLLIDSGEASGEEFDTVCGCDMMSELLASMNRNGHAARGVVLLTNLTNPQVVRTSEMVDVKLVILLRGKLPAPETMALAKRCGISLMTTPYTMYRSCGILYTQRLRDIQPADREA